jgi:DNA-binding HxlR family transcriptional regulator
MTRTSLKDYRCSIAQFAEILGDKWALLIIRDAFGGVRSFSGFAKSLGIANNVLTERLRHLVDHGILVREQVRPDVDRHEYRLTPAGRALFPITAAMMQWGDKWVFGREGEPVQMLDRATHAPVQAIAVLARDGRFLGPDDVEYARGPGWRGKPNR